MGAATIFVFNPVNHAVTVTSGAGDSTTSGALNTFLVGDLVTTVGPPDTVTGDANITATFASTLSNSTIFLGSPLFLPPVLTLNTGLLTGPLTLGGTLSDLTSTMPGKLIKAGAGTLAITGFGTNYMGGTEVQAGTLQLDGGSLTGTITVDGGATLDIAPTSGDSSSILGHIRVDTGGTALVDLSSTPSTKLSFELGSGISLNGGAATLNFGMNTTLSGASSDLGASTISSGAHSTITNFRLGDHLNLTNFTDPKHTTAIASGGTLTVQDNSSTMAVFGLTNSSLNDDGTNTDETVVVLTSSVNGSAVIAPAIDVSKLADDPSVVGSLRHALQLVALTGGIGDVVLFDPSINNSTINIGGTLPGSISGAFISNPLNVAPTDVKFDVTGGNSIILNGLFGNATYPGGLNAPGGFHKIGHGTLTLTGDQRGLGGTTTVSGGTLDIETSNISFASSFTFDAGLNATLAGISAALTHIKGNTVSISNFDLGHTIKLTDFDHGGGTLLSTISGGLGVNRINPEGTTAFASITVSGPQSDYVLLRDSLDGSALIRPAIAATTPTTLSNAIATLTSAAYSQTSGDVIDLTGTTAALTLGGTLNLGTSGNVILFATQNNGDSIGSSVTIDGAITGNGEFWKVGAGTLTLEGDESGLGTITVGGGTLAFADSPTTQSASKVTAVDLSPGHATISGSIANIKGLAVNNYHLGNMIEITPEVSGGQVTVTNQGGGVFSVTDSTTTVTGSVTISLPASAGFASETTVAGSISGSEYIIPVVSGTASADVGDLGGAISIAGTGNLDLTAHGSFGGKFLGSGTLSIDLPNGAQAVAFTNTGFSLGGSGDFTGQINDNSGILDISANAIAGTALNVGLTGSHAELKINQSELSHLALSALAQGAAIDIKDLSPFNIDFADSGVSIMAGSPVLQIFTGTPGSPSLLCSLALPSAFSLSGASGGLQFLPDGNAMPGTLIAFGNDTISVAASSLAPNTTIGNGFRPTTLSFTGGASGTPPVLDLLTVIISPWIEAIDATSIGSATVRVSVNEVNSLSSITGAAATLQVSDSGTIDASNLHLTGVQSIDFAGPNQILSIGGGGGGPPTGLKFIHGSDPTDLITGPGTVLLDSNGGAISSILDLSGVAFSGNGHIVGSALDDSNNKLHTEYRISDGGVVTHIDPYSGMNTIGQDTINFVDTLQLPASFTADEIGYAFANNFVVERNGIVVSPGGAFTPPGGSAAIFLTTIGGSGSLSPASGVAHFVLPSGSHNLSAFSVSGGTDANPVVLFGSPGSPVTLPGSVAGQSNVEFVVNSGNNLITAGSAPAIIWGGSGSDSISLTGGAGTLVGGSGSANLDGGSASATVYGGAGGVLLFGAAGGGSLSGGGDYSIFNSGGGHTFLAANPSALPLGGSIAGAIHQTFFGSQIANPLASDQFTLSPVAQAHDLVAAGPNASTVTGAASDDTVLGGTGSISVTGGSPSEHLLFEASQSSGGQEVSMVHGNGAGQLVAFGGDGKDALSAGTGSSTLIGGTGNEFFSTGLFGATGSGYILSQTSHDSFQFMDGSSVIAGAGRYIVEGFDPTSEALLVSTASLSQSFANLKTAAVSVTMVSSTSTVTGSTLVPISASDTYMSHLIGQTALELTLQDGVKIDLVGVSLSALTPSNLFVSSIVAF